MGAKKYSSSYSYMKETNKRDKNFSFDFDELIENSSLFNENSEHKIYQEKKFNNLANSIKNFFLFGTKKNTLVGITGLWGSGKTTFCRFLEKKLSTENNSSDIDFRFCFFDLWKHQNDPIKKSILMNLTSFLVEKDLVDCNVSIQSRKRDSLDSWLKRVRCGFIKKTKRSIVSPVLSIPFILILLIGALQIVIDFSNIVKIFCNLYDKLTKSVIDLSFLALSLLLSLGFIFLLNIITDYSLNKRKTGGLFSLFVSNAQDSISEESNNNDLTADDFRNWISTILFNLKDKSCIILVLDNLDRLPAPLVKDFLSYIQEIFLELDSLSSNSSLHIVVPFDYVQIKNIYKNDDKSELERIKNNEQCIDNTKEFHQNNNLLFDEDIVTNDVLNKTFSCIFYLPHNDPNNIRDFFSDRLLIILNKSREKNFLYNKSNIYTDDYIVSCCWNLLSSKYPYSIISFRNMLSFLRELAVILQINANNIRDKEEVPFVIYAAFYTANVSIFRTNSFASSISTLNSQWKEPMYGIYSSDESEQEQKHLYYQFMGAIYYQASFQEVSGDLFFDILDDSIANNNYDLVLDRVCSDYFLNNPEEVIGKVLERNKNSSDIVANIFSKIMDENEPLIKDNLNFWSSFYRGFIFSLIKNATGQNIILGGVGVCFFLKKIIINYLCQDYFSIKTFLRYVLLVVKYHLLLDTRDKFSFCENYLNAMLDVLQKAEISKTIRANFQFDNSYSAAISEDVSVVFDDNFFFKSIRLALTLTETNSFVLAYLSSESQTTQERISNFICITPIFKNDDELLSFVESYPVYQKARIFFKDNIMLYDSVTANFISCFIKYSFNKLNKIHSLLEEKERFLYFANLVYKYFMLCMYNNAPVHEDLSFDDLTKYFQKNTLGKPYPENPNWTPFINFICIFYLSYLDMSENVSRKLLSILAKDSLRLNRDVTSGYTKSSTSQASGVNTNKTSRIDDIHKKNLFSCSMMAISDEMNSELSSAMKTVCYIHNIIIGKKKNIDITSSYKELVNLNLKCVFIGKNKEELDKYLLL